MLPWWIAGFTTIPVAARPRLCPSTCSLNTASENGCFLDLELGLLGIKDEKLLMRRERTAGSCCRVRLAEPVEIEFD